MYRTPASVQLTPEQLIQFGFSLGMTLNQLQYALISLSKPVSKLEGMDVATISDQQNFYAEVFNLAVDFSGVEIPQELPGFGWVLIVPQGLTLNKVWARCKEMFSSYSYLGDDLDKSMTQNERTSKTAYAKWFRNCVEADEELKNLSANQLAGTPCITLLERLLLELWYFWKNKKHLDLQNITLCAGSRFDDGFVPDVHWLDGRLRVYCDSPGHRDAYLRARAAV